MDARLALNYFPAIFKLIIVAWGVCQTLNGYYKAAPLSMAILLFNFKIHERTIKLMTDRNSNEKTLLKSLFYSYLSAIAIGIPLYYVGEHWAIPMTYHILLTCCSPCLIILPAISIKKLEEYIAIDDEHLFCCTIFAT